MCAHTHTRPLTLMQKHTHTHKRERTHTHARNYREEDEEQQIKTLNSRALVYYKQNAFKDCIGELLWALSSVRHEFDINLGTRIHPTTQTHPHPPTHTRCPQMIATMC